jgi:hypothetical protein
MQHRIGERAKMTNEPNLDIISISGVGVGELRIKKVAIKAKINK